MSVARAAALHAADKIQRPARPRVGPIPGSSDASCRSSWIPHPRLERCRRRPSHTAPSQSSTNVTTLCTGTSSIRTPATDDRGPTQRTSSWNGPSNGWRSSPATSWRSARLRASPERRSVARRQRRAVRPSDGAPWRSESSARTLMRVRAHSHRCRRPVQRHLRHVRSELDLGKRRPPALSAPSAPRPCPLQSAGGRIELVPPVASAFQHHVQFTPWKPAQLVVIKAQLVRHRRSPPAQTHARRSSVG